MKSTNNINSFFEYVVSANVNKLEITKFMGNLFDKLSKQDNLIDFLSNLDNLATLESIAYLYETGTKNISSNTSYIIGNEFELIEENYYLDNTHIKVMHFKNEIIIGIYDNSNNIFINGKKYVKLTNSNYISYISIVDSNIDFSIKESTLVESGKFIYSNNLWLLDGDGIKYYNSNGMNYKGIFVNGHIIEGTEFKSNVKTYQGKFNEFGAYDGVGTLYLPNGCVKYQGDFKNGKEHGNGSSYYQNDYIDIELIEYVGEWYNGIKHGSGILFSIGGDEIYSGQFENDQIA
jgi:hypothetical protein